VPWTLWLSLAVVVSVLFAVTALKPRGGRPVANTRLMLVARAVLLITVAVLFYLTLRQRAGH
jgi:hypothetical protein